MLPCTLQRYKISMRYQRKRCVHLVFDCGLFCLIMKPLVDPLLAFAFLQTFVDILKEYFGAVSVATVRENLDIVYQVRNLFPICQGLASHLFKLLEETLDSGGYPLTTSPNALRDIVLPPSLFNKLLSAAANFNTKINPVSPAPGAFSSPIPWRKAGLRYASNEIYIDLIEELRAVVNKYAVRIPLNCPRLMIFKEWSPSI